MGTETCDGMLHKLNKDYKSASCCTCLLAQYCITQQYILLIYVWYVHGVSTYSWSFHNLLNVKEREIGYRCTCCPGCSWLVCLSLPFYLVTKLLRHAYLGTNIALSAEWGDSYDVWVVSTGDVAGESSIATSLTRERERERERLRKEFIHGYNDYTDKDRWCNSQLQQ